MAESTSVTLESNELIQDGAVFQQGGQSVAVVDLIGNSVIEDYANGRAVTDFKGGCHTCKTAAETMVSDWEKGDVMEVGQIIEDSGQYWRVTGRNFERDGFPFVTYELLAVD